METATAIENFSLTMTRQFNASKQAVYEAWTKEEALTAWFAPSNEMKTITHQLELQVGGKYRLEMLEPDGTSHTIHGEYVELNPYEQLVFTWEWEGDEQKVNSLVTINLWRVNGKTEMILTHEKLTLQDVIDLHSEGRIGCLAQLEAFFH